MVALKSLFLTGLYALAVKAANVSVAVGASDPTVGLSPFGSWFEVGAPGEFPGGARFLLQNANEGVITWVFTTASTTFEFWGYQRSDGGLYSISFDGGPTSQIDVFNASSTGNDGPLRLFSRTGLTNTVHSIRIVNLFDTRPPTPKFGQMNVDHFVITGNPPGLIQAVAPTFPPNTFLAEGSLQFSYHAALSLGAHSAANGGDGGAVEVLLDSGAAAATWVIWNECTEAACGGHNTYVESNNHFTNFSIVDTEVFGNGGPANTISAWRVNDTVSFSNITVLSTTFGAAFQIPTTGEGLDGNFNIAKSFCAGAQCANYPSFVEGMFEAGTIHAPVIAFYQLNSTDQPAAGVTSRVDVGGIDRNKFIGSMDWIPITQDSMWINPSAQRFVKGAGNFVNATSQFTHTSLTFDTGDPGLLGLPTNDWDTLTNLVGAQTINGNLLFPCASEITLNFRGTQFRNYTFSLVDTTTNNGNGFCNPTANDAGDTTNWITGAPFLDNYYIAFYFGNAGINSTLGFGVKNLAASAATAAVVIGQA